MGQESADIEDRGRSGRQSDLGRVVGRGDRASARPGHGWPGDRGRPSGPGTASGLRHGAGRALSLGRRRFCHTARVGEGDPGAGPQASRPDRAAAPAREDDRLPHGGQTAPFQRPRLWEVREDFRLPADALEVYAPPGAQCPPVIVDFSFLLDLAYAEIGLRGSKLKAFHIIHDEIKRDLPPPALLVHLNCDAKTELQRVRTRGRAIEESVSLGFLKKLNRAVERQVANISGKTKVVSIDSARKNFVKDEAVKQELMKLVLGSLEETLGRKFSRKRE